MNAKTLLSAALCLALFASAVHAAPNGPSFTAVVDAGGTLVRGFGVDQATRVVAGRYEVQFAGVVNQCSYTASVGLSGDVGSADPGIVTVGPRPGKPKVLVVQTFTPRGAREDRGFHLIVAC